MRLKDVPAAHYMALVSDGDWKLLTWTHMMLLSAEILLKRCVTAAKYGPMHLIKVLYFCLSSVFKMAYTSEFLQFLLSDIPAYFPLWIFLTYIYLHIEDSNVFQINRNWGNLGYNYGFPKCITLPPTLAKVKKVFVSHKEVATYVYSLAHQQRKYFLNMYSWGRGERSTRSTEFATS